MAKKKTKKGGDASFFLVIRLGLALGSKRRFQSEAGERTLG
jgi:hypothetical protein